MQAKQRLKQAWSAFAFPADTLALEAIRIQTHITGQPTARQPAFSDARTTKVRNFPALHARDSVPWESNTVASLLPAPSHTDRRQYGLVVLENRLSEHVPFRRLSPVLATVLIFIHLLLRFPPGFGGNFSVTALVRSPKLRGRRKTCTIGSLCNCSASSFWGSDTIA